MKNNSTQSQKAPVKPQILSLNIQKTDTRNAGIAAAGLMFNKV